MMPKLSNFLKITFLVVSASFLTYCGGNSEEMQKLKAENEELRSGSQKDSAYIKNINAEMDELYASLDSMRSNEERIRQMAAKIQKGTVAGQEGVVTIDQSFANLEKMLAENQAKVGALQAKLSQSGKENAMLKKMVDELNKQIQDKDRYTDELKVQIGQLQEEVKGWQSKYATTASALDSTSSALTGAQDELSKGYYTIGTRKELDDRNILERKGLFKGKIAGLSSSIKPSDFTLVDVRYQEKIVAGGKEVEAIIPERSKDSYAIEKQGGDNVIVIKNAKAFWENKYLVVVIKK